MVTLVLLVLAFAGCSDTSPVTPEPEIAFLVGNWQATSLVVRPLDNPAQETDLLTGEGTFFRINVQPSGQYTATLNVAGFPSTEIGRLDLTADRLTFRREFPTVDVSAADFTRLGENRVRLVGATQFDFSGDLVPDDAELVTELERR